MFLRKIVLALMAIIVFAIPTAGGGFSFDVGIGPLGLMSIAGLLTFFFAVAFLLFGNQGLGRTAVPMDRSVMLFGVLVALNFASVGWAQVPAVAISSSISYLQVLVFVWLLLFLRSEPWAPGIILHAFFFGSLLIACSVLYEVALAGLDSLDSRLYGFDMNPNNFGYKMVLGIPVAFYLYRRSIPALRWLYLSYIPAAALLVVMSGSRTASVELLLAIGAIIWFTLKMEGQAGARLSPRRLLLAAGALIVVSVAVYPYLSGLLQTQIDRIATLADPMESRVGGRWDLWVAGVGVYFDNLLLGVGSGGSQEAILPYLEGAVYFFSFLDGGISLHNTLLAIMVETGTVGFLIYLAVLASLLMRIKTFPRQEALLFLSLMGVSLVAGLAGTYETSREFNLALFLSIMFVRSMNQPANTLIESKRRGLGQAPIT